MTFGRKSDYVGVMGKWKETGGLSEGRDLRTDNIGLSLKNRIIKWKVRRRTKASEVLS